MNRYFMPLLTLPLVFATPAEGQDVLAPIGQLLKQLAPAQPAPAPARTRAPEVAPPAQPLPPVPRPRPDTTPDAPKPVESAEPQPQAEPESPAPPAEPDRIYQAACPAVVMGLVEAEMALPLSEKICGERSPLTVTGVLVHGRMLPLSSPVTTNCQMASALPAWLETVDGYAQTVLESPLASVTTGTSYQCRARVSTESQFTSEHGFANALDVVGFALEDGRTIAVTENWLPADDGEGRLLRLAHDAACGQFMTVLGPEANDEHKDHLHLDMGCHGSQCVTRICE